MKIKKIMSIPAMAAVMALAVMTGCGKGSEKKAETTQAAEEMYEHISADATAIARFDLEGVLENAGADFSGGQFKAGKALQPIIDNVVKENPGFSEELLDKFLGSVDIKDVVLSASSEGYIFFTAPLLDKEFLTKELDCKAFRHAGELEGFDVYICEEDDELYVMFRGEQVWLTNHYAYVISDYANAATNPVAGKAGLLDVLREGDMTVVMDVPALYAAVGEPMTPALKEIKYGSVVAEFKENKLSCVAKCYNEAMKPVDYDFTADMAPVTNSELKMMPADANIVMALGKPSEKSLDQILDMVGGLDQMSKTFVKQALGGIEGSIVVGLTVPESERDMMNPAAWDLTLAVGFNEDAADGLLSMASMFGARKSGNGYIYRIDYATFHFNVYFGYANGQLVISTSPLDSNRGFKGASQFDGSPFGIVVDLPAGSGLLKMAQLTYGLSGELYYKDSTGIGNLELTGTNGKFLETIIESATR